MARAIVVALKREQEEAFKNADDQEGAESIKSTKYDSWWRIKEKKEAKRLN